MKRRQFISTLSAVAAATAGVSIGPAFAAADPKTDATQFIADFAQKGIVDILAANITNADKQQRFRTMFKEYFDIPAIERFVLGRYSRTLQPADQEMFDNLFEDVIVYTWSRRFGEYNGQSLKVSSSMPDGPDGFLVKSSIVGKSGDTFEVDWRARKHPDGLKAVDVIVAGVSMAITYRQEYTTVVAQNGGFPALIAQLQKQVADLKRQQPA